MLGRRDQLRRLARQAAHHLSVHFVLRLEEPVDLGVLMLMAVLAALALAATLILAAEVAEVVAITLPSPEGLVVVAFLAAVAVALAIVVVLAQQLKVMEAVVLVPVVPITAGMAPLE